LAAQPNVFTTTRSRSRGQIRSSVYLWSSLQYKWLAYRAALSYPTHRHSTSRTRVASSEGTSSSETASSEAASSKTEPSEAEFPARSVEPTWLSATGSSADYRRQCNSRQRYNFNSLKTSFRSCSIKVFERRGWDDWASWCALAVTGFDRILFDGVGRSLCRFAIA
jgi:hypothetical protein